MLVKCKCHGEKKDRDSLFKIVINGKNEYYCSEVEYLNIQIEKESRIEILNSVNEIFGYIITNTIWFKELSMLEKTFTYTKISSYINNNRNKLTQYMNKQFNNEYSKIKYFTTILRNNLADYIIPTITKENIISVEEIISVNYKAKSKKKSLSEFINEME